MTDDDAAVRAFAVWLLGNRSSEVTEAALTKALKDSDRRVRRRACEAFVRNGLQPPLDALTPCLNDDDRWLRYAAREALKRLPIDSWRTIAFGDVQSHATREAMLGLYQVTQYDFPMGEAMARLRTAFSKGASAAPEQLELLRLVQLTLIAGCKGPDADWIGQDAARSVPAKRYVCCRRNPRAFSRICNPTERSRSCFATLGHGTQERTDSLRPVLTIR